MSEKVKGGVISDLMAENRELRRIYCLNVAGARAYMDDGEAQDGTERPHIDFLRDSLGEIQAKLAERLANRVKSDPDFAERVREATSSESFKQRRELEEEHAALRERVDALLPLAKFGWRILLRLDGEPMSEIGILAKSDGLMEYRYQNARYGLRETDLARRGREAIGGEG